MNISDLEKIIEEQTGLNICPICGTPFTPYHSRQKTCGSSECKRLQHNLYLQERRRQMREENIEEFNRYHAAANRKWRKKQKFLEELDELAEFCREQTVLREEVNLGVTGLDYGKKQAEKILASVPKIDVEGFMKERNKDDNIHDKDK